MQLGLNNAREFAIEAHGQQRYGDRPYVEHLSDVVRVLEHFGFADDYIVAGWLHDVVEDTSLTIEEISVAFGNRVAKLVWAVTGEGAGDREAHSDSIYRKISAFPHAAVVKLADRIANIEACKAGDRHSVRYAREHTKFAQAVQQYVPASMWQRYIQALEGRAPREADP